MRDCGITVMRWRRFDRQSMEILGSVASSIRSFTSSYSNTLTTKTITNEVMQMAWKTQFTRNVQLLILTACVTWLWLKNARSTAFSGDMIGNTAMNTCIMSS